MSSACAPGRLVGFWHAAGVLHDALLDKQDSRLLQKVYGPKADASRFIHSMVSGRALRSFVLFSSIAALQGGSAQANYSAANATLDTLAICSRPSRRGI